MTLNHGIPWEKRPVLERWNPKEMGILVTPTMDMSNFDTTVPHQSESNHALLRAVPSTGGSASTVRCRMRQTGITAITTWISRERLFTFLYNNNFHKHQVNNTKSLHLILYPVNMNVYWILVTVIYKTRLRHWHKIALGSYCSRDISFKRELTWTANWGFILESRKITNSVWVIS